MELDTKDEEDIALLATVRGKCVTQLLLLSAINSIQVWKVLSVFAFSVWLTVLSAYGIHGHTLYSAYTYTILVFIWCWKRKRCTLTVGSWWTVYMGCKNYQVNIILKAT